MATSSSRATFKVVILLASLVAMISIGGGFVVLIALLPFQWWAFGDSPSPRRRFGWLAVMALSTAELGWGAAYLWVSDSGPVIWVLPLGLAVATVLTAVLTARGPARVPSSRHA
jgi:hypothetical protein